MGKAGWECKMGKVIEGMGKWKYQVAHTMEDPGKPNYTMHSGL